MNKKTVRIILISLIVFILPIFILAGSFVFGVRFVTKPQNAFASAMPSSFSDGNSSGITWAPETTMTESTYGQPYTWTPSESADGGDLEVTYSVAPTSALPAGFVLDPLTGKLTSNKVTATVGTYSIVIRASVIFQLEDEEEIIEEYVDVDFSLKIVRAERLHTVSIMGWTFGDTAKSPSISPAAAENGAVTYQYSATENGVYAASVPVKAGTHWVRAVVAQTENFKAFTTVPISFVIARMKLARPSLIQNEFVYNTAFKTVQINATHAGYALGGVTSTVGAGTYYATVTLVSEDYMWATGVSDEIISLEWRITPAPVSASLRSVYTYTYGFTVSDIVTSLSASNATFDVQSGGYSVVSGVWSVTSVSPNLNAGERVLNVKFTPNDIINFLVWNTQISIQVSRADRSHTVSVDNLSYGSAVAPRINGVILEGANYSFEYSTEWYGDFIATPPTDARDRDYWVRAVIGETTNYKGLTTAAISFKILRVNRVGSVIIEDWVYGSSAKTPTIYPAVTENPEISWWYYTSESGAFTDKVPVNAGTYWISAVIGQTTNYNRLDTEKVSFKILRAARDNVVTIAGWTFGESANSPVVVGSILDGAKVTFEYSNAPAGVFTNAVPTSAGNYYVRAVIAETANHYAQTTAAVEFVIAKANRQHVVLINGWTFGAAANAPAVVGVAESAACVFWYSADGVTDWQTTAPTLVGTWYVRAVIASSVNYNAQTTVATSFEIARANRVHTVSIVGWIYSQPPNDPTLSGTVAESAAVRFEYSDIQRSVWTASIPSAAGIWFVRAVVGETNNYKSLTTAEIQFVIAKSNRAHIVIALSKNTWQFGEVGAQVGVEPIADENASVIYRYSSTGEEGTFTIHSLPTNAGVWYVHAIISETTNYNQHVTAAVMFTINKADRSHTLTMNGWAYTPTPTPNPLIVGAVAENAQVVFEYSSSANGAFSTSIPTSVGEWFARARISATANYDEYITAAIRFEISRADRSHTVSLEGWTYGWAANSPVISGTVEGAYEVQYSNNADSGFSTTVPVNAGTWFLRVVFAETAIYNAQITATVQFIIERALPPSTPVISGVKAMGLSLGDISLAAFPGWSWMDSSELLRGGKQTYAARYQHPTEPDNFVVLVNVMVSVETDATADQLASELRNIIQSLSIDDITLEHENTLSTAFSILNDLVNTLGVINYNDITDEYPQYQLDIEKLMLVKEIFDAKLSAFWTLDDDWWDFMMPSNQYSSAFGDLLDEIFSRAVGAINSLRIDEGGVNRLESLLAFVTDTAYSNGESAYEIWQQMSSIAFGELVYSPTFSFIDAAAMLPTGVAWCNNLTDIVAAGTHVILAEYELDGFAPLVFTVIIKVAQADHDNQLTLGSWVYGNPNTPAVGITAENAAVNYYYSVIGASGPFTVTERPSDAGTYWIKAVITATTNYKEYTTETVRFIISKSNRNHTISIEGWTFGAFAREPIVNGAIAESASVIFQYFKDGESGFMTTPPTAVGTWLVRAVIAETSNFNGQITDSVQFVITKSDQNYTVSMSGWTFGQEPSTPLLNGVAEGVLSATYYYSLSGVEGTFVLEECPSQAGTYFVRAVIGESETHNSQITSAVQFVIRRAERSHSVLMLGWVFGQTSKEPTLNGAVLENAEVKYYYSSSGAAGSFAITDKPSNAGLHWVRAVVSETANYSEQVTASVLFVIERAAPHTTIEIVGLQRAGFLRDIGLPEGWRWVNPNEELRGGTDIYYVDYKHPTQPDNYVQRSSFPITLTVENSLEDLIALISRIELNLIKLDSEYILDIYNDYLNFVGNNSERALLVTNREVLITAKNILEAKRNQKQRLENAWVEFVSASNTYIAFRGLMEDIYTQSVASLDGAQFLGGEPETFISGLASLIGDAIEAGESAFNVWEQLIATNFNIVYMLDMKAENLTLPDGVFWNGDAGQTILTAGMHTLSAKYNANGFSDIAFNIIITVAKAVPVVETPLFDGVQEAGRLSSLALPTGWEWEEPQRYLIVGVHEYWAVFTPFDVSNYVPVRRQIAVETENAGSSLVALIETMDTSNIMLTDAEQILSIYEKFEAFKAMLGITSDNDPIIFAEIPNIAELLFAKNLIDVKIRQQALLNEAFSYLEIPVGSAFASFRDAINNLRSDALSQINALQSAVGVENAVRGAALAGQTVYDTWEQLLNTNFNRTYTPNAKGENTTLPNGIILESLTLNGASFNLTDVLRAGSGYVAQASWVSADIGTIRFEFAFFVAKATVDVYTVGGPPVISGVHTGKLGEIKGLLPARWLFENEYEIIKPGVNKYMVVYIPFDSENYYSIRLQIEVDGGGYEPVSPAAIQIAVGCLLLVIAASIVTILTIKKNKKTVKLVVAEEEPSLHEKLLEGLKDDTTD